MIYHPTISVVIPAYNAERTINAKYFRDNCYYDGYWQSYHYLEKIKQYLLSSISLTKFGNCNGTLVNDINDSNSAGLS